MPFKCYQGKYQILWQMTKTEQVVLVLQGTRGVCWCSPAPRWPSSVRKASFRACLWPHVTATFALCASASFHSVNIVKCLVFCSPILSYLLFLSAWRCSSGLQASPFSAAEQRSVTCGTPCPRKAGCLPTRHLIATVYCRARRGVEYKQSSP